MERFAPNQNHSIKRLCELSAKRYHNLGKKNAMLAALNRIQEEKAKLDFLMKHKYYDVAYPILRKQGM